MYGTVPFYLRSTSTTTVVGLPPVCCGITKSTEFIRRGDRQTRPLLNNGTVMLIIKAK